MLKNSGPMYLISFHTTADAMALEKACRESGCPGRLIPVPRAITSDCGFAWASPLSQKETLDALIAARGLEYAGKHHWEKL